MPLIYTSCQDKMKSTYVLGIVYYLYNSLRERRISTLFWREFRCSPDNGHCLVCALLHSVNDGFNVHLFYFVWAVVSLWYHNDSGFVCFLRLSISEYSSMELELADRRPTHGGAAATDGRGWRSSGRSLTVVERIRLTMSRCARLVLRGIVIPPGSHFLFFLTYS